MIDVQIHAWMAGFFDGEGCVAIRKDKSGRNKGQTILVVNIGQKRRWVLEIFQNYYGGGIHHNKANDSWSWYCAATRALRFLEDIEPYTINKADEVRVGIYFQWTKTMRVNKGVRLTERQRAVEEAQYIMLRSMKKNTRRGQ